MPVQVVRCCPVRNGLINFFPPAIVNSQIAQVDRAKNIVRMVSGSCPLLSGLFITFSLFNLKTFLSLSDVNKEEKLPDIACGMYVVKWDSSIIDLRIWNKSLLIQSKFAFPAPVLDISGARLPICSLLYILQHLNVTLAKFMAIA